MRRVHDRNPLVNTQRALSLLFLILMFLPPGLARAEPTAKLEPGQRVRVTDVRGREVEGTVEATSREALTLSVSGRPTPLVFPSPDLIQVEVFVPPPSRMDYYAGFGAFVGLGIGLLMGLSDIPGDPCSGRAFEDCDLSPPAASDGGMAKILAFPLIGVGVGALVGILVEGEGVWEPVSVRWVEIEGASQLQLTLSF